MLNLFIVYLLLFTYDSFADYFPSVDGSNITVFEEHNPRSYDLFQDNLEPVTDKIYLKISSGLSYSSDIKDKQYLFKQNAMHIPMNIAIGIKFSPLFNIELFGYTNINHDMKKLHNTDYLTYRFNTYAGGISLSMDLIQSYDVVPYIAVGGGVCRNDWRVIEKTNIFEDEKDILQKFLFNYHFAMGAKYKISQNFCLFVEYAYRKVGDLKEEEAFGNNFCLGFIMDP